MVCTLVTSKFSLGAQLCQCLLVGALPAGIPSLILVVIKDYESAFDAV